jgi:hypothetical protein
MAPGRLLAGLGALIAAAVGAVVVMRGRRSGDGGEGPGPDYGEHPPTPPAQPTPAREESGLNEGPPPEAVIAEKNRLEENR